MITILNPPDLVQDPVCIVRTSDPADLWQGESRKILGTFARVHTKTGEDWQLLRNMRHGIDYFSSSPGSSAQLKTTNFRVETGGTLPVSFLASAGDRLRHPDTFQRP